MICYVVDERSEMGVGFSSYCCLLFLLRLQNDSEENEDGGEEMAVLEDTDCVSRLIVG